MKKGMLQLLASSIVLGSIMVAIPAFAGDNAAGKKLYTSKCQMCHGAKADKKVKAKGTAADWEKIVKSGKGAMPAIKLKDDEIKSVVEYMLSLKK